MLDQLKKKTKKPNGNNNSPLEVGDVSAQVPDIDDVLAEIDKAINTAERIEKQTEVRGCGCGGW